MSILSPFSEAVQTTFNDLRANPQSLRIHWLFPSSEAEEFYKKVGVKVGVPYPSNFSFAVAIFALEKAVREGVLTETRPSRYISVYEPAKARAFA